VASFEMSSKRQRNSKGKRKITGENYEMADAGVEDKVIVEDSSIRLDASTEGPSAEVDETSSNQAGLSLSSDDVSWQRVKGTFYPFHVDGTEEEGEMVELAVTGTVVDAFLSSMAKSHTVSIKVEQNFIDGIKRLAKSVPGFQEYGFRWPFESDMAKFTEKEFVGNPFPVVWDG
jgi:hypothetical protein